MDCGVVGRGFYGHHFYLQHKVGVAGRLADSYCVVVTVDLVSYALHGLKLRGLPFTAFLVGWLPSGFVALPEDFIVCQVAQVIGVRRRYLEWGVPLLFGGIFAGIFLKANPDSFIRFWGPVFELSRIRFAMVSRCDICTRIRMEFGLLSGFGSFVCQTDPEIVSSEKI